MAIGFLDWLGLPSAFAAKHVRDDRARLEIADATHLPSGRFDAVVSAPVLDFVPDISAALRAMGGAAPGGGYAGHMELTRHFWDAAVELDRTARDPDDGVRSSICRPERLERAWHEAGFVDVASRAIDGPTIFRDFDDYWRPFLGGQAPAPGYAMSLSEDRRAALRDHIRARLPIAGDGSISLIARAWAVRGRSPVTA